MCQIGARLHPTGAPIKWQSMSAEPGDTRAAMHQCTVFRVRCQSNHATCQRAPAMWCQGCQVFVHKCVLVGEKEWACSVTDSSNTESHEWPLANKPLCSLVICNMHVLYWLYWKITFLTNPKSCPPLLLLLGWTSLTRRNIRPGLPLCLWDNSWATRRWQQRLQYAKDIFTMDRESKCRIHQIVKMTINILSRPIINLC